MFQLSRSAAVISLACLCAACNKAADAPAPPAPAAATSAQAQSASTDAACTPNGDLKYLCGIRNAEDIVRIGTSDWLIVSSMAAQGDNPTPGRVYLVNHRAKSYEEWFPAAAPAFRADAQTFGTCPGRVNTNNFSPHGLALHEQSQGKYRLYMTSHGEREAIEVFTVDATGDRPSIAWVGCVVLPEKTFANSVAILPDGGFVTTKMMDPTAPGGFASVMAGGVTGHVYEWHPGGKVTAMPGTELAGANGIEVSPDQRWMFVTAIGSREIIRFDRNAKPMTKQTVQLNIRPDNLRWTEGGKLFTVGGNFIPPAECASPPCSTGWSIIEIDPETLQTAPVAGMDQTAALQGASTALQVGNEIWIGTFNGDRVGYLPRP